MGQHPYHLVAMLLLAAVVTALVLFHSVLP